MTSICAPSPKSYAPDELRTHVGVLEVVTAARAAFRGGLGAARLSARLPALLPAVRRARSERGAGDARSRARAGARSAEHRRDGGAALRHRRRSGASSRPMRPSSVCAAHPARATGGATSAGPCALRLDAREPRRPPSRPTGSMCWIRCRPTSSRSRAWPPAISPTRFRCSRNSWSACPTMSFPVSSLLRAHAFQHDWAAVDRLLALAEQRQLREFQDGLPFIRAKRDPSPAHIGAWRERARSACSQDGLRRRLAPRVRGPSGPGGRGLRRPPTPHAWGRPAPADDIMGPDGYRTALLFQAGMPELRNDPRFAPLCARLGLVEFWLASGKWPDCAERSALRLPARMRAGTGRAEGRLRLLSARAPALHTVTNDSPLCAALIPSSVAFTDFQLFSALMRASQPCTYG